MNKPAGSKARRQRTRRIKKGLHIAALLAWFLTLAILTRAKVGYFIVPQKVVSMLWKYLRVNGRPKAARGLAKPFIG